MTKEQSDVREVLARTLFIASDDFTFADRMAKAWDAPGSVGRQRWYRYADVILAAGFSRAAVPDAATELSEMRKMAEEAKQNPDGVEWQKFWDRLTEDQIIELLDAVSIARAERDAALAAVERVRAINTGSNRALYGNNFEAGMAKALWLVKTALDGAPETSTEEES